jgi:tRNA uridine 5-carbamoylmethylation protein Kti12
MVKKHDKFDESYSNPREPVQVGDVAKMLVDMGEQGVHIDNAAERRRRFRVLDSQTNTVKRTLDDVVNDRNEYPISTLYTAQDVQDLRAEVLDVTARREQTEQDIAWDSDDPQLKALVEDTSAGYMDEVNRIMRDSAPDQPPEQP